MYGSITVDGFVVNRTTHRDVYRHRTTRAAPSPYYTGSTVTTLHGQHRCHATRAAPLPRYTGSTVATLHGQHRCHATRCRRFSVATTRSEDVMLKHTDKYPTRCKSTSQGYECIPLHSCPSNYPTPLLL